MDPSDDKIQQAKDKLTEYAQKIKNGNQLHPKEDAIELDVDGGRIRLLPGDDGTEVNIHLFDDTENRDFTPADSRLNAHLTHELDAPIHGPHEPYTPFISNERMHIRFNLAYLQEN